MRCMSLLVTIIVSYTLLPSCSSTKDTIFVDRGGMTNSPVSFQAIAYRETGVLRVFFERYDHTSGLRPGESIFTWRTIKGTDLRRPEPGYWMMIITCLVTLKEKRTNENYPEAANTMLAGSLLNHVRLLHKGNFVSAVGLFDKEKAPGVYPVDKEDGTLYEVDGVYTDRGPMTWTFEFVYSIPEKALNEDLKLSITDCDPKQEKRIKRAQEKKT